MNDETITIICPECETKYPLSMDTLRASESVRIVCKGCTETQLVRINSRDEIEITTNPTAWKL
ncbi:MAG: hypothetical protein FWH35_00540 [Treponema sp.]|nr:hypothetical protein [Treponema sp.]